LEIIYSTSMYRLARITQSCIYIDPIVFLTHPPLPPCPDTGERWFLDLKTGGGSLVTGEGAGSADLTVTMGDSDFFDVSMGKLNAQQVRWGDGACHSPYF
jgi:hypothetical protein